MKYILLVLIAFIGGCSSLDFMCKHEYQLLKSVKPWHPEKALEDGVEGWVAVSLSISVNGNAKNIVVVGSEPKGIFEQEALNAVGKFTFSPQYENCQAVQVNDIRYKINFNIVKDPNWKDSSAKNI